MKVREWIAHHPGRLITVDPQSAFESALDLLLETACLRDVYVVDDDGRPLGHLSHARLAHLLLAGERPSHTRRQILERVSPGAVGELMDPHFAFARPDEELDEVLHRQLEARIEDMPVIDGQGRLVGAVNLSAVLKALRGQSGPTQGD
jgi:CBS domain-containing protein